MITAQLTQNAPRLMTDVKPPMSKPASQPVASVQAQLVTNLPVKDPEAKPTQSFNPIMSAEHSSESKSTVPDKILHEVNHAVQAQQAAPPAKKGLFKRQPKVATTSDAVHPKPVLESVLLITACLVACVMVVLFLGH